MAIYFINKKSDLVVLYQRRSLFKRFHPANRIGIYFKISIWKLKNLIINFQDYPHKTGCRHLISRYLIDSEDIATIIEFYSIN